MNADCDRGSGDRARRTSLGLWKGPTLFAYSGTVSLSLYVWSYALSRRRAASPLSPISGLVVPAAEATLAVTGEITPNASSASASAARREHVRSAIFGRTPMILDHSEDARACREDRETRDVPC